MYQALKYLHTLQFQGIARESWYINNYFYVNLQPYESRFDTIYRSLIKNILFVATFCDYFHVLHQFLSLG